MISLENKHILVSGASSGIGQEVCRQAATLGARLTMLSRNSDNLSKLATSLEGNGHQYYSVDITNYDALETIITEIIQKNGPIDGFVHSAGIEMTRPLKMLKPLQLNQVLEINLVAGVNIARLITKLGNVNENGASLLFISSIVGLVGQPGKIGYSASKGAVIAASKSMALELASRKIRVNAVVPAMVETDMSKKILDTIGEEGKKRIIDMHPLGLGSPLDVAQSCCFLLSDSSKWITGTSFVIDGGYSAS